MERRVKLHYCIILKKEESSLIKRLARCIREYKWAALLSPITMIGEVAMEVLIPLVMADLYDYGIVMQDMTKYLLSLFPKDIDV